MAERSLYFDPGERAREKQAAREKDDRDLREQASAQKSLNVADDVGDSIDFSKARILPDPVRINLRPRPR